ncbi:MAG: hypothetical protein M3O31_09155 [Acidobacteriota bacterium]|nr:hypothetical protein [Acidobacteriota bacterium]
MIPSIIVALLLVVTVGWEALYPDRYDPKNIHYVLWKWHLAPIDLDRAVSTMHHDQWSERMILGKSEDEVTRRFGYLLPPEKAPSCFRAASSGVAPPGDEAFFLRKSDYLVIFHNRVAVNVVLLNQAQPC